MSANTAAALEECIRHWERNAAVTNLADVLIGLDYCALCEIFNNRLANLGCEGCPVKDRTGFRHCFDTPYSLAAKAWVHGNLPRFKKAAQEMVDFLKGLREEPKP